MSPTLDHIADIPAYIFGQSSQRVCPSPTTQVVLEGAEHSLGFYISLFVVLVTYIFWINYWSAQGANHKTLFSFLGYQRGDYTAKLGGLNPQFKGYLSTATIIGIVVLWVAAASSFGLSSQGVVSWGALVVVAAVYLYQMLLIHTISYVVGDKEVSKMLLRVKGVGYAIVTIFTTPIILCYALSSVMTQDILFIIVTISLLGAGLIFLFETFLLFIYKKVSLLHSILYLCTVEIFPITLIWGFFK